MKRTQKHPEVPVMIRFKHTKPWDVEATENWVSEYFRNGYRLNRVVGPFFQYIRDEGAKGKRCYMSIYVQGHDSVPDEWKLKCFYWTKGFSSYVYEMIRDSRNNRDFCLRSRKERYGLIRIRMGLRAFAGALLAMWGSAQLAVYGMGRQVLLPLVLAAGLLCGYSIYSLIRLTILMRRL